MKYFNRKYIHLYVTSVLNRCKGGMFLFDSVGQFQLQFYNDMVYICTVSKSMI